MFNNQTTKQNIQLNVGSTTADICEILERCESDSEIEECVSNIQRQGRCLFGANFNIRFDRSIISEKFRERVFIKFN